MTYCLIVDNKAFELAELLRLVNALDLLEQFNDETVGLDDLMTYDINDLIQLGLSSDRAQQLIDDIEKEVIRKRELLTTLIHFKSEELYDRLVKIGYKPTEVHSMDHNVLKKIDISSFPERMKILKKIQMVSDADAQEEKEREARRIQEHQEKEARRIQEQIENEVREIHEQKDEEVRTIQEQKEVEATNIPEDKEREAKRIQVQHEAQAVEKTEEPIYKIQGNFICSGFFVDDVER